MNKDSWIGCLHLFETHVLERSGKKGNGILELVLWDGNGEVIERHDWQCFEYECKVFKKYGI